MTERGLLLKPDWAELFAEGLKTLEIRNHFCRCLKPGELVYIVASGQGRNCEGVTLLKIVGKMNFVGNEPIAEGVFKQYFQKHKVSQTMFKELLAGWKKPGKDVKIIGWEFMNIVKLERPLWIRWNHDPCSIYYLVSFFLCG